MDDYDYKCSLSADDELEINGVKITLDSEQSKLVAGTIRKLLAKIILQNDKIMKMGKQQVMAERAGKQDATDILKSLEEMCGEVQWLDNAKFIETTEHLEPKKKSYFVAYIAPNDEIMSSVFRTHTMKEAVEICQKRGYTVLSISEVDYNTGILLAQRFF